MSIFGVKGRQLVTGLKQNVSLSPYTTWKVGGNAEYFWEPCDRDIEKVMRYCYQMKMPVYYFGRGSNVLVDDAGLRGLTICTRRTLQKIHVDKDVLLVQAGVPLPKLAKFAADSGIRGFEFLIGIPGTVGAGVAINAGLSSNLVREMKDVLINVEVITQDGERLKIAKEDLGLSYRSSEILNKNLFVLCATFAIEDEASPKEIRQIMAEHLAERKRKQPVSKATAGSTFKQPVGGKPAGWYIDRAGLKGYRIGGAVVSHKHANWIENNGGATAKDIRGLIAYVQATVHDTFGISLEREIRYLPEESILYS